MAFCPKCKGEMGATEIVCPHCGYDFPSPDLYASNSQNGIAYSRLADIALVISMISAGLGCVVAVVATVIALLHGQLFGALVVGPIAFFLQLGMLVVFLRIQNV